MSCFWTNLKLAEQRCADDSTAPTADLISIGGIKSGLAVTFDLADPANSLVLPGAESVSIIRFLSQSVFDVVDEAYWDLIPTSSNQVMLQPLPLLPENGIDMSVAAPLRTMDYQEIEEGGRWGYEFADYAEFEELTGNISSPLIIVSVDGVYYVAYALIGGLG